MTVDPGELRAIIGPKGAGQDHVLQLDQWISAADFGPRYFRRRGRHRSVAGAPSVARHRGHLSSHRGLPQLSARENLRISVEVASGFRCGRGFARADPMVRARVSDLLDMGGLSGKAHRLVGELAHGDQRAPSCGVELRDASGPTTGCSLWRSRLEDILQALTSFDYCSGKITSPSSPCVRFTLAWRRLVSYGFLTRLAAVMNCITRSSTRATCTTCCGKPERLTAL